MKYLKFLVIAAVMAFTFGSAKAQVVVRARVGGPVYHHRHWHHRHVEHLHHRHHHYYYK